MTQENFQSPKSFHLAGIIPVETETDFNLPWNDSLIPIAPNYLAIERAVYECASVGCETIWIVCNKETTPLLRYRLGDWLLDPTINAVVFQHTKVVDIGNHFKQIPIFYVPIHPKDKARRRTGISWSILHGHNCAKHVSRLFSRWTTPSKYYVAFPHAVYSSASLRKYRKIISSKDSVYISYKNKTVKDGELLAFTFDSDEYKLLKKAYHEQEKLLWRNGLWKDGEFTGEMLPIKERYNSRFIELPSIMKYIDINPEYMCPIKWGYNISTWDQYCEFLGSRDHKKMKRPRSLEYHEFNKIGEDIEIEDDEGDSSDSIDEDHELE